MADEDLPRSRNAPSLRKVLDLLGGLRRTESGALIHDQVVRILDDYERSNRGLEEAYATILSSLFDALAEQLRPQDPRRLQIRVLERRLRPPLLESELNVLREHIDRWREQSEGWTGPEAYAFPEILDALLQDFGIEDHHRDELVHRAANGGTPADTYDATDLGSALPETGDEEESPESPDRQAEQAVNLAYRHHLDEKNRNLQSLESALVSQINDSIEAHRRFRESLQIALDELRDQNGDEDVATLRAMVIQQLESFLAEDNGLVDTLGDTYKVLQRSSADSRRLSDELDRVRQLSLSDELTGLPNRRAFGRKLEEEIARIQRYDQPLTLAMIDLDGFKRINDEYGHPVGDEVLRAYADRVFSIFRHQDMVARFGGEEFAVLLPGTTLQGGLRALEKIRARVGEVTVNANGHAINLPTFSAGVAPYHPGENAESYMARADAALYQAKRQGRDRIEVFDGSQESRGDSGDGSGRHRRNCS